MHIICRHMSLKCKWHHCLYVCVRVWTPKRMRACFDKYIYRVWLIHVVILLYSMESGKRRSWRDTRELKQNVKQVLMSGNITCVNRHPFAWVVHGVLSASHSPRAQTKHYSRCMVEIGLGQVPIRLFSLESLLLRTQTMTRVWIEHMSQPCIAFVGTWYCKEK